jgi:hypothetical protein
MNPQPPPAPAVQFYDVLIATHADIERKGKSSPYTSVNGNMFTILSADGTLGMRLAAADRNAFIAAVAWVTWKGGLGSDGYCDERVWGQRAAGLDGQHCARGLRRRGLPHQAWTQIEPT